MAISKVARTRIRPQLCNVNQQNAHFSNSCFNLKSVHSFGLRYITMHGTKEQNTDTIMCRNHSTCKNSYDFGHIIRIFICILIPTYYNSDFVFVLAILKMATCVTETYRWLLYNKVTFIQSSAFASLFKAFTYVISARNMEHKKLIGYGLCKRFVHPKSVQTGL